MTKHGRSFQHSFHSLIAFFVKPFLALFLLAFLPLGPRTTATASDQNLMEADLLHQQYDLRNPEQSETEELKPGLPLEREMQGSEAYAYRITVTQGQYLHVVVEQKGIDVVVRLFAPDGTKITEVDSPNGTQGPEPVSLIAEVSGVYRLEVRSLDDKAPPGRYEIRIDELREATRVDLDRVAAERMLAEAELLRAQGTAQSRRQSIDKYREALPLLRKLEDRQREAATLNQVGLIYWQLGELQKALDYFNLALPLSRSTGNRQQEGSVLANIGTIHWQRGDSQNAFDYYNQALVLKRTVGDRRGEAITLNSIGLVNDNLGKLQEALDYYNQALALQRAIKNDLDEATTLTNIGATYYKLGELQKALEFYNLALPLKQATGDRQGEAVTLNGIGLIYWRLGENEKALEYHTQTLSLRRAVGDRFGEVSTLTNIGSVYWSSGDLPKALEYYNQALSLTRTLGDRRGESSLLQNIGTVYRLSGETQSSLDFLNQALQLRRALGDRWGEAITLSLIGATYSRAGKPEEALNEFDQALTLHRAVGDKGYEATTLLGIARAERDLGRLDAAKAHAEAALQIVEGTRSKFASQDLRTSYLATNESYYEFYIDLLMRLQHARPQASYDSVALQASERARARSLLETLAEAHADIREGADSTLLQRERSLQEQLNSQSERLTRLVSGKHSDEQEISAKKQVEALLEEYQDVEAQIRLKSPRYAALMQLQPLSLKEIQQQLDVDTLLLEYSLGEERSYLWAVTSTSIKSYQLPRRAEIEARARQVYETLTARNKIVKFEKRETKQQRIAEADANYLTTSTALSQLVLAPVSKHLPGKRLLIVSDGALHYVPFGALPILVGRTVKAGGYRPLISEHEVVNLPSASVLAESRKDLARRQSDANAVAVFADPVFQDVDPRVKIAQVKNDNKGAQSERMREVGSELERSARDVGDLTFERLPYTRQEAEGILAFTQKEKSLKSLDFEASRATATNTDLSQYRIVHFATHALLNSQHPELSGIVLSLVDQEGRPQNGFLRTYEIYNLKLRADLVVLSACRTALGKEIKGEGLVGLTRGFMYAGAARVIASLWGVEDASTAELMKSFYYEMLIKHRSPAAALRAAQLRMWKKQLPPYYWAAFLLQGEWK
jgi:CHAT domain-containing protein